MFGVLLPHVCLPVTLYRLVVACDFGTVMFQGSSAKGAVELKELGKHFFLVKVSQGLVFNIAIDIGG